MRSFKKKILKEAIERLSASLDTVTSIAEEEKSVAERLPGNLKRSGKYDTMMKGSCNLQCAADQITLAIKCIENACS